MFRLFQIFEMTYNLKWREYILTSEKVIAFLPQLFILNLTNNHMGICSEPMATPK
jgi:hypothetical protein